MKLYEINEALEELLERLTVDPETGEIPVDSDEIIEQIDALTMEKQKVLEYLAKCVLNVRSDTDAINDEIERLKKRKESLAKRDQSLMRILERECEGKKTDLGVAVVSYRSSEVTEVDDDPKIAEWLIDNGHRDAVNITQKVTVDKTEIKHLIKSGIEIPGCTVTKRVNCSLR